ncbi:MAG: response regulator transcription factor [Lachnospiraceae bacterium]|nr:response regulator transcription factor [Lachnospiraceae bacterium]
MKILLAEDTADLNRVITAMLEHEGYNVDSVLDGVEATEKLTQNGYDGIILDIMMPRKDGIEVLNDARKMNITTPVLLLTAKSEVDDRVAGLDAGADDYLTKPFAMKELMARVRAMTRRRTEYSKQAMSFGDISLDASTFSMVSENTVRLSTKEFEFIQMLVEHAGVELDENFLLTHVWSDDPDADSDTVWLYCNFLRRKLQAVSSKVYIEGQKGISYKIIASENDG